MKIAYLLLAHNDPTQLKRLINALDVDGSTYFFIHIDKKQSLGLFLNEITPKDNIIFIKERVVVNWGGYSICQAEKELLSESLQHQIPFDRFILLSGLDYPLWSNERMFAEYINNPQKIYMKAYNLSKVTSPVKIPQRIRTYHFRDLKITNNYLRHYIVGGLMHIMNHMPLKKCNYIKRRNGKWDVYGGAQWFNITRECALYAYEQSKGKDVCRYFKTSFAPDELMFQTIIFNSKFKRYAECFEENGIYPGLEQTTVTHYIEYEGGQKVFDENDFDKLVGSGKMFCRKLRTGVSEKLIEKIDEKRENEDKKYSNIAAGGSSL